MSRGYNFSAGPAALPEEVLRQAQAELLEWNGARASVMEISHRGKDFIALAAEFERDLIRERTLAGLHAARARGRHGGRPRLLASAKKVAMVRAMYADKTNSVEDICQALHISRATLYRYLKTDRAERLDQTNEIRE